MKFNLKFLMKKSFLYHTAFAVVTRHSALQCTSRHIVPTFAAGRKKAKLKKVSLTISE